MGRIILIIAWLNRVVMLLFVSLILIGFTLIREYFFYALMLAIFLGFFQIIAALILSPLIAEKDTVNLKKLNRYTNLVGLYIVICFVLYLVAESIPFNIDFLGYVLVLIPIILSLFFTYITEQIYKINKNERE